MDWLSHTRLGAFRRPDVSAEWKAGPRVRVDTLKSGTKFLAIDGERWEYIRRDGALSGVYHCVHEDGHASAFAGCAEVVIISREA